MSAEYIQIVERVCTLPRRFPPNKLCVDRSKDPHHDGLENRALKIVFSFASVWPIWMSGSRDSFDFSYRQCLSRISFFFSWSYADRVLSGSLCSNSTRKRRVKISKKNLERKERKIDIASQWGGSTPERCRKWSSPQFIFAVKKKIFNTVALALLNVTRLKRGAGLFYNFAFNDRWTSRNEIVRTNSVRRLNSRASVLGPRPPTTKRLYVQSSLVELIGKHKAMSKYPPDH